MGFFAYFSAKSHHTTSLFFKHWLILPKTGALEGGSWKKFGRGEITGPACFLAIFPCAFLPIIVVFSP
jgi:hypothetical protein